MELDLNFNRMDPTIQLLQKHFPDFAYDIPESKTKSEWNSRNKCGFLLGIVVYGEEEHVAQIRTILSRSDNLTETQEDEDNRNKLIDDFIENSFQYYIKPFHKSYTWASTPCHTPTTSRANSTENLLLENGEKQISHYGLKKSLLSRDRVCLFCWQRLECEAAHIIAQKNFVVANVEHSILARVGLTQKHQVQNGLLLCKKCHGQFDKLKSYVDVVDDRLVVKLVKDSNNLSDWRRDVREMRTLRQIRLEYWAGIDNRIPVEGNDEMALFFVDNSELLQPNRAALHFHKTTCMIWRLAGGAEIDDEECSLEDEEDFVKPRVHVQLKDIQKWQESSATLVNNKNLSA